MKHGKQTDHTRGKSDFVNTKSVDIGPEPAVVNDSRDFASVQANFGAEVAAKSPKNTEQASCPEETPGPSLAATPTW